MKNWDYEKEPIRPASDYSLEECLLSIRWEADHPICDRSARKIHEACDQIEKLYADMQIRNIETKQKNEALS